MGVATAAAISAGVAIAVAATTTGVSAANANKASKAQDKAAKEAQKSIDKAVEETYVMPGQERSLNLDTYRASQEQSNIAAATATRALQKGDYRQVGAGVGYMLRESNKEQQATRLTQIAAQEKLDKEKATERARASDQRKTISEQEAEGAAAASADAMARETASTTAAVQGVSSMIQSGAGLYGAVQGPYDPTDAKMATAQTMKKLGPTGMADYMAKNAAGLKIDMAGVDLAAMSESEASAWAIDQMTAEQIYEMNKYKR